MRSINIIVGHVGSGVFAWVQVLLRHLLAVWHGATDIASLCLHFLIHKIESVCLRDCVVKGIKCSSSI